MDINILMELVNDWIKEILKDNYVGVYFHGSLRLGSFNPNKSDLDFIIVIKEKIDSTTKQKICDKMLDNVDLFPKKGFEFSVVLEKYCKDFIYPTPYELHMSESWIEQYKKDISSVVNEEFKVDTDLASHFNVINVFNNSMDFGLSSKEVFMKVPKEYVIESNYNDILECVEEIVNNPIYCILNLCRFYALVKDDLTLSKYDGGKWYIENIQYNPLVEKAMNDYISNINDYYDNDILREFANEVIELINSCLKIKRI